MASSPINPNVWANWLEAIQGNDHPWIARDKESLTLLNKLSGQKALTSSEIVKISQEMLISGNQLQAADREKIIKGINRLVTTRKERFSQLGIFAKFFARLWGVERNIKIESNEAFFQYAKQLHESKQSADPEQILKIEALEDQLHKLHPHLPTMKALEDVFSRGVLKNSLDETVSSLCKHYQIDPKKLKRDCNLFNCDLTEMKAIYVQRMIRVFRTDLNLSTVTAIEETWRKISKRSKPKTQQKIIDKRRVIFISQGAQKEGEIYVVEKLIALGGFKAAFTASSLLGPAEKEGREGMVLLQPQEAVDAEIEADENEKSAAIEDAEDAKRGRRGELLAKGAQAGQRKWGNLQVLKPQELDQAAASGTMIEHIPAISSIIEHPQNTTPPVEQVKNVRRSTSGPLMRAIRALKPIPKPTRNLSKEYQQEAQMCLQLRDLPGIWTTHLVTTINGQLGLIQKAAGYKAKLKNNKEVNVIDLGAFLTLAKKDQLTKESQVVFLNMIGNFLRGVQSLHRKGIIHRDLKPENILCALYGHAGITDFGISCDVNSDDREMFAGTNYYVAPEISRLLSDRTKWKDVNTKADIWETGIILWELLSGKEIYDHPALRHEGYSYQNDYSYQEIGGLCDPRKVDGLTAAERYAARFPEPRNRNSLLHIIWSCTRADPNSRIDIDTLIAKYDQWAERTKKELDERPIYDIFSNEWEAERPNGRPVTA